MNRIRIWIISLVNVALAAHALAGAKISYQLPYADKEQTYRVTLAVAPKDQPDWIIANFISGGVRTANAENKGHFTDEWDGIDDNYKPAPAGQYVVRGIYMPAEKWRIDGQYHSITAQYLSSPGDSWAPPRDQDNRYPPIHGHVFEPIYNVAAADNGQAVFLAGYVENEFNPFLVDLNRDIGIDQVIKRFNSSGMAGGHLIAFDGTNIWMVRSSAVHSTTLGGFGTSTDRHGKKITVLSDAKERPTDITVVSAGNHPYLYLCEPHLKRISVLDGLTGAPLKPIENVNVVSTCVNRAKKDGSLIALQQDDSHGWRISAIELKEGQPSDAPKAVFNLPEEIKSPGDIETDKQGNIFLTDGRVVRKFSADGKMLLTIGKDQSLHGAYDPEVFVGLTKLCTWSDSAGKDRIILTETGGSQRLSEWSCEDGKFFRSWNLCQNAANGYCLDPQEPQNIYTTSLFGGAIERYVVDYETGAWKVDAIWQDDLQTPGDKVFIGGRMFPEIYNLNGQKYLCFGGGSYRTHGQYSVMRWDKEKNRWLPSAGLLEDKWWHDANGDGHVQDDEYVGDNKGPGGSYWSDKFLPDLSIVHVMKNTNLVWRNAPKGFDTHGNPIYDASGWKVVITDKFVTGNHAQFPPLQGGNEVGNKFWDWSDVSGSPEKGLYVAGVYKPDGPPGYRFDEAGSVCAQWKLTYWEKKGDTYALSRPSESSAHVR